MVEEGLVLLVLWAALPAARSGRCERVVGGWLHCSRRGRLDDRGGVDRWLVWKVVAAIVRGVAVVVRVERGVVTAQFIIFVNYDVIADVDASEDVRGSHNEAETHSNLSFDQPSKISTPTTVLTIGKEKKKVRESRREERERETRSSARGSGIGGVGDVSWGRGSDELRCSSSEDDDGRGDYSPA
ncbi:hypothetical protein Sjap_024792 [Stephania japonica]|uniref:Secreted protein n=1 Tax=Stephania japonica TaxID=461633 RepID=A0AAP0EE04_9MAGN